jgi:hypothetical protein
MQLASGPAVSKLTMGPDGRDTMPVCRGRHAALVHSLASEPDRAGNHPAPRFVIQTLELACLYIKLARAKRYRSDQQERVGGSYYA